MKSASSSVQSAAENVREVKGVKVLATRADNLERAQLRVLIDNLRNKLGSGVVVLGSVSDGKVALIVGVTKDLTAKIQAGKIIAEVAKKVGGSGGGRPDMAEAGGKDPSALDSALAGSYSVVEELLRGSCCAAFSAAYEQLPRSFVITSGLQSARDLPKRLACPSAMYRGTTSQAAEKFVRTRF